MRTTTDDRQLLPLYEYVRNGLYTEVERWVAEGKPLFNPESRKFPAIVYAARSGFFSILELLIRQDWRCDQKGLNKALEASVEIANPYAVQLLLDHGSDPDVIGWDQVFYPRIPKIIEAFFQAGKSTRTLHAGLDYLEKNTAATVRDYFGDHPEIESCLFLAAREALRKWSWDASGRQIADRERKIQHCDKIIGLLRWIGLDLEKRFPDVDYGAISIREMAQELKIPLGYKKKRSID